MKKILTGLFLSSLLVYQAPEAGARAITTKPVLNKTAMGSDPADTITLNGRWFLQAVLPSDTATGSIPSITFTVKNEHFTGNTGCNTMSGTFKLTGKSLQFDNNIILTKKVCTGFNEAAFIKSLLRTDSYKFEKDVLILMYGTTELSRWTRQPVHAPTTNRA